jgi:hypothetical protein
MAELVETVESQKQASHEFPQLLGNLAKGRRDSPIPTAPTRGGKVENQKQVSHFPAYGLYGPTKRKKKASAVGLRPPASWRTEGDQKIKPVGKNNCR